MRSGVIKIHLIFFLITALTACKIVTTVPKGGKVLFGNGALFCGEGKTCSLDVVDSTFDQTFKVQTLPGNAFVSWESGGWCEGSDQPCRLSTNGLDKYEAIVSWFESDVETILNPVFSPIVKTVACTDDSVPSSFSNVISTWGVYFSDLDLDKCSYARGDTDRSIEAIAFFEYGDRSIPLIYSYWAGGPTTQEGIFGPGDLVVAVDFSDELGGLSTREIATVLSIDSDRDPETGKDSFGVIGADYRAFASACVGPIPDDFDVPLPEGVEKAGMPRTGYLEYWSEPDGAWRIVEDEFFGRKIGFITGGGGWALFLFSGFGGEGIGIPELVGVHIELLGENCARTSQTKIDNFLGVYDN